MNSLLLTDGYKTDHRRQYPGNTTKVVSNWTPRGSRKEGIDKVVMFGLQYFIKKYMVEDFNTNFFGKPKSEVTKEYTEMMNAYLGPDNQVGIKHIEDLHDLGYLPIAIYAIPEGHKVPLRVPMFSLFNTKPEFFWLTNYFETIISTTVWVPMTSATIANQYREQMDFWANKTSDIPEFVDFQGHDFSMRGMAGLEAAMMSGAGHLLSFKGTDTIPAITFLQKYYNADGFIGGTVAATEHSVMSMGSKDGEFETFKRLITEIYPNGIVSIVSDTWDLWKVLTDYMPRLKKEIMARDGKVVIRPDSGDPADIICGKGKKYPIIDEDDAHEFVLDYDGEIVSYKNKLYKIDGAEDHLKEYGEECFYGDRDLEDMFEGGSGGFIYKYESGISEAEQKGVVELLYDTFGGTVNSKGYIQLDSHVGAIYGDSITIERSQDIQSRLADKGFASTNVVFGIGSYTYQYNTRDTFGFAMKATYGELTDKTVTHDGNSITSIELVKPQNIFKDPITDNGLKKSARGLVAPFLKDGQYELKDQLLWDDFFQSAFVNVYRDGKELVEYTLEEIRENMKLEKY